MAGRFDEKYTSDICWYRRIVYGKIISDENRKEKYDWLTYQKGNDKILL